MRLLNNVGKFTFDHCGPQLVNRTQIQQLDNSTEAIVALHYQKTIGCTNYTRIKQVFTTLLKIKKSKPHGQVHNQI